ncbi:Multidrug transporter EmrE [Actinopolymorpha cephalotaxi]|uniref:Multidrug transporter EmrE n=1 Tax=Actinopolymorpha cephalotaxi TaxID=504797 RepID=A0A1I2YV73_9ACTN|nr:multidrug efflux SMR transporter [Actinopolymorpha cephalotaxi]SFH29532.1 Multidrug transporter EmrE [Actinopolymorpha cephalotaxi]
MTIPNATTTPNATPSAAATTTPSTERRLGPWVVLLLAGVFEIGYALSVGGSHGFTALGWSVSAVVFFLLTLFALSVALKRIDVGIGYAVWAGIGAVGAALLGPVFFDETLTQVRAFWLAVIIGGVVWLKLTDSTKIRRPSGQDRVATYRTCWLAGPRLSCAACIWSSAASCGSGAGRRRGTSSPSPRRSAASWRRPRRTSPTAGG